MKTPDEIKKALECCFYDSAQCGECHYYPVSCDRELVRDAREYIRQLEAELEDMTARYKIADDCAKKKGEMNEKLYAELSAVKAERDAVVEALKNGDVCEACKHFGALMNEEPCASCSILHSNFEWRGVMKEE